MNKGTLVLILLFIFLSGCIEFRSTYPAGEEGSVLSDKPEVTNNSGVNTPSETQDASGDRVQVSGQTNNTTMETLLKDEDSDLLIDRISKNLSSFYDKKWNSLYQEDELDCSRMSTYFWDYIRNTYHVAPKIVVSYQRQHAWIALKVSDTGNSTKYRHWDLKGTDYYYLEATIPKLVADDNQRFLVNDRPYTSAEFYNASIDVFDTPQDANDFHSDYSMMGGWNQEFRLKKEDLDKIEKLLE